MVERLTAIPTLVAWKDGQGDIRRLQTIMNRVGDRLHWIGGAGDDMVAAYYSIGIRTFTSSIATVAPRLSLRLHELGEAGDAEALTDLAGPMRGSTLRVARAAQGLRSVGDESNDGHGRSEWWSSAPTTRQRHTGRRRRTPHNPRHLGKIFINLQFIRSCNLCLISVTANETNHLQEKT